ncbi:MAG TPA: c-type cytochrome [Chloroflexota bacterium]
MTIGQIRNLFIFLVVASLAALAALSIDSVHKVSAERTPAVTPQVREGKGVWQANNCNDCHTILGIGGYFAPDLTKVADTRDPAWLKGFLTDPQKAKPGTTMPNLMLSSADADNLVAFFQWVSKIDTNNWPPKPIVSTGVAPGASTAGATLVQQKGCLGCHNVKGQGASGPGPNLSAVGGRIDRTRLLGLLANPRSVNPSATMPIVPMTDGERSSVADYLLGLK